MTQGPTTALGGTGGVRPHLTRREREILLLLARGENDKVAARCLGISERSVRAHVTAARQRLHARSRSQLIALAMQQRLIDID